jgi:hypothetical protein
MSSCAVFVYEYETERSEVQNKNDERIYTAANTGCWYTKQYSCRVLWVLSMTCQIL